MTAWGVSWGVAWADSWLIRTPVPPPADSAGTGSQRWPPIDRFARARQEDEEFAAIAHLLS